MSLQFTGYSLQSADFHSYKLSAKNYGFKRPGAI